MRAREPRKSAATLWAGCRVAARFALIAFAGCSELCGMAVGGMAADEEVAAHRFRGATPGALWSIVREEVARHETTAQLPEATPALGEWAASEWVTMNDVEDRRVRARLRSDDEGATIHVEIEAESRQKANPDGPTSSLGAQTTSMLAVIERADPAGHAAITQRIEQRGAAAQQGCRCVEEQFPTGPPAGGGTGAPPSDPTPP